MTDSHGNDSLDSLVARLVNPSAFEAGGAEAALRADSRPSLVARALVARLREPGWPADARRRALRLLSELSVDPELLFEVNGAILEAARSPDPIVRASAALALGRRGGTVADDERESASPERAADSRITDVVVSLLDDPARDVRAAACSALERSKPGPGAIARITQALAQVAARTAAEAPGRDARSLAPQIRQEQRDLLRALEPFVEEPSLPAALRPLVPLLLEIARDPSAEDPDVRLDAASRAATLLARSASPAAMLGLVAILDDGTARNGEVLDSVAFALGELGGAEAEEALTRELARPRLRSFEAAGYPETVRAALLRARRTR